MTSVYTRQTTAEGALNQNAPLTNEQLDANFINLNNEKQATLVSGTNIKTINGASILGPGDLELAVDTKDIFEAGNYLVSYIAGTYAALLSVDVGSIVLGTKSSVTMAAGARALVWNPSSSAFDEWGNIYELASDNSWNFVGGVGIGGLEGRMVVRNTTGAGDVLRRGYTDPIILERSGVTKSTLVAYKTLTSSTEVGHPNSAGTPTNLVNALGYLSDLNTNNKTSFASAINEAKYPFSSSEWFGAHFSSGTVFAGSVTIGDPIPGTCGLTYQAGTIGMSTSFAGTFGNLYELDSSGNWSFLYGGAGEFTSNGYRVVNIFDVTDRNGFNTYNGMLVLKKDGSDRTIAFYRPCEPLVATGAGVNDYARIVEGKQDALVSGTNIKTVNGTSLTGSGNLAVGDVTLTGTQTLTNKTIIETVSAITGTTPALTVTNGAVQTWTLTAASTPTNALTSGQSIILVITPGAYAITWPSVTWTKQGGSGAAPTLFSAGKTSVVLWMVGSVLYGSHLGDTV